MNAELELGLERRIGKRSAAVIEKHLGITTVGGLLNYFPAPLPQPRRADAHQRGPAGRGSDPDRPGGLQQHPAHARPARFPHRRRDLRRRRRRAASDAGRRRAAGHAQGQLLQRLPGQGRAAAGPARHVLRQGHALRRIPGPDQPRFPAAGRGPRHAGHGPGEARRHADPGVPGHGEADQLVHPEGHLDAAGHRGPGSPRRPAAGGDRGAGEVPAGRGRLPADPRPANPGGLAARPGPVPLPGSPGAPVGPGPAPRPARRRGSHRPPPGAGRAAARLRPPAAVHADRRPGRRRQDALRGARPGLAHEPAAAGRGGLRQDDRGPARHAAGGGRRGTGGPAGAHRGPRRPALSNPSGARSVRCPGTGCSAASARTPSRSPCSPAPCPPRRGSRPCWTPPPERPGS